jgi:MULE transposase-like protein/MuDR family transposase
MKKLKIRKMGGKSQNVVLPVMAADMANGGNIRIDDVGLEIADVADNVRDELESANAHVDVREKGPLVKNVGINEVAVDNPRSEINSATISTENALVPIVEPICDFEDSTDEDYSGGEEDEYEDDADLFAENVVYGLDDVFIGDDEIRVAVDKEIIEENNRDIYYNEEGVELESDDDDLAALDVDEEGEINYPTFNPEVDFKGKINLSLGLKFPSTYVFRKALRYHAIECGYNYYYLHNGSTRITAFCFNRCNCSKTKGRIVKCVCGKEKKCNFKVHAKKLKDEETLQIRSYFPKHTCGHQHQNNKVTALYLAEKYIQDWRENPNWELKAFEKRVNRELGCEVKYSKCYMAKRIAMRMIFGDASEEYSRVWDYAEAIRLYNPGSTAIVKCIGIDKPPPLFQRMYICLPACKEGFVAGCRPIIGVDGAHLKGQFPGILLTAVGKDGNNNIFPIAWAVVETENVESWTWFLNLLVEDLRSVAASSSCGQDFTFMSDRQKV